MRELNLIFMLVLIMCLPTAMSKYNDLCLLQTEYPDWKVELDKDYYHCFCGRCQVRRTWDGLWITGALSAVSAAGLLASLVSYLRRPEGHLSLSQGVPHCDR
jgi:hypothetical protein